MSSLAIPVDAPPVTDFSLVYTKHRFPSEDTKTAQSVLEPKDVMARRPGGSSYPLWRVQVSGRPTPVRVFKEEGVWLAEQEWLNVCGVGGSPAEALADAEVHIRHFLGYYADAPQDSLTGLAVTLKERYADVTVR